MVPVWFFLVGEGSVVLVVFLVEVLADYQRPPRHWNGVRVDEFSHRFFGLIRIVAFPPAFMLSDPVVSFAVYLVTWQGLIVLGELPIV